MSPEEGDRWMIWVDGVGGFLVLARSPWIVGGPASEREGAISVQAALRRREAELSRAGRDYSLRRFPPAIGNGQLCPDASEPEEISRGAGAEEALRRHDTFCLGAGVEFTFCCPHPLSASARLTVGPRFRFRPHADAVLLLADTLLLGATGDCHLVAPHAERTHVLFRRKNDWYHQLLPTGEGSALATAERVEPGQRTEICGVTLTLEPA